MILTGERKVMDQYSSTLETKGMWKILQIIRVIKAEGNESIIINHFAPLKFRALFPAHVISRLYRINTDSNDHQRHITEATQFSIIFASVRFTFFWTLIPCPGFMWETAKEFGAMVVFAEHRFYGLSLPGGFSFASPDVNTSNIYWNWAYVIYGFLRRGSTFNNV